MDLVQIAVFVAQNPLGLMAFLLVVVWWTTTAMKEKDNDLKTYNQQMKEHYDEDKKEAGEREKWYQKNIEWQQRFLDFNNKQLTDMANDIKDLEALMIEGRVYFESVNRDDQIPPDSIHPAGGLDHLRRKLSTRRNTK